MSAPRKSKDVLMEVWARPKNIVVAVDGSK